MANVTMTETPSHRLQLTQEKQVAATVIGAAECTHVRERERFSALTQIWLTNVVLEHCLL